jgi:hypothetical protein
MSFPRAPSTRPHSTAGFGSAFSNDAWHEPEPEPRDWKKLFLIVGLAGLSWVATYVGMLELIESNMGSLPITHKLIIGFSVAMLMTMVVWLLDQMFSPIDWFTRITYIGGYVFLTAISVGFGFGFYWKVLESRSEAARSAESAVGQVQSSLHGAATRLEQLQGTLLQLSTMSAQKAELERTQGTSCPNSSPGDGPRRKMRDEDAARFNYASEFVKGRVNAIKGDMAALDTEMARIVANDPTTVDRVTGTRNEFMRSLGRRLDMTVTGFNAFRTDPQLRQIRTDLADRAERTSFDAGGGKAVSCPDAQLQVALRGVVRAIDQLPTLEQPQIAAVEGSEATIEAFRRLTATFFGLLSFELPPSADELRELQQRAVQSIENPERLRALQQAEPGLAQRDYIPLGVALFVDLCLLLVSIGRPMNRFVATRRSMLEAERGPVFPILSRFSDIHNHEEMRRTFDVFRDVIFESGGTYYVAVPLNAPREHAQREQLRRDAQALANLCYALEGQGVLTRPWKMAPGLVARRKLRRQGSKFIECYRESRIAPIPRAARAFMSMFVADRSGEEAPAFRIYAFKKGAWPEMILGAVMGAAARVEAERRSQPRVSPTVEEIAEVRAEFERSLHDEPPSENLAAAPAGLDDETGREVPREATSEFSLRPGVTREPFEREAPSFLARGKKTDRRRELQIAPAPGPARVEEPVDKVYRQRFGTYAGLAEVELSTYRDPDESDADVAAANSNTAPPSEKSVAPVVVPFPALQGGGRPGSMSERLAAALSAVHPGDGEPSVDIELRRETATVRVPVSHAALPEALREFVAQQAEKPTASADGEAAQPQLELLLAPPVADEYAAGDAPQLQKIGDEEADVEDIEVADFEPPRVLRRMVD